MSQLKTNLNTKFGSLESTPTTSTNFTGEIEPEDGETTFTVQEEWTLMQDVTLYRPLYRLDLSNEMIGSLAMQPIPCPGGCRQQPPSCCQHGFSYPGEVEEYVHHETDVLYLDIANNEISSRKTSKSSLMYLIPKEWEITDLISHCTNIKIQAL